MFCTCKNNIHRNLFIYFQITLLPVENLLIFICDGLRLYLGMFVWPEMWNALKWD